MKTMILRFLVDVIRELSVDELTTVIDDFQEEPFDEITASVAFELGYDISIGPSDDEFEGDSDLYMDEDEYPIKKMATAINDQATVEYKPAPVKPPPDEFPDDWDDMPPPPDHQDDWFDSLTGEKPAKAQVINSAEMLTPAEPVKQEESVKQVESPIKKTEFSAPQAAVIMMNEVPPVIKKKPPVIPPVMPVIDVFRVKDDAEKQEMRMITVVLRSNHNDIDHGVRCMKRVVGLLRSYPGKDKFGLLLFDGPRRFQLEFPNDTTGYSPDLIRKLKNLVGEENVSTQVIKIH